MLTILMLSENLFAFVYLYCTYMFLVFTNCSCIQSNAYPTCVAICVLKLKLGWQIYEMYVYKYIYIYILHGIVYKYRYFYKHKAHQFTCMPNAHTCIFVYICNSVANPTTWFNFIINLFPQYAPLVSYRRTVGRKLIRYGVHQEQCYICIYWRCIVIILL